MLAPLRPDHVLDHHREAGAGERRLDRLLGEVGCDQREALPDQQGGLPRLEPVGGDDAEDDHVPTRAKDAGDLRHAGVEILDDLDDVATPDEVERGVWEGDGLDRGPHDANPRAQAGAIHRQPRLLDESAERVDAHAARAGRAHELDQVRRVATAHVEHHRRSVEPLDRKRQHRLGTARVEAPLEEVVHPPRLRPVDPGDGPQMIPKRPVAWVRIGCVGHRSSVPELRRADALVTRLAP